MAFQSRNPPDAIGFLDYGKDRLLFLELPAAQLSVQSVFPGWHGDFGSRTDANSGTSAYQPSSAWCSTLTGEPEDQEAVYLRNFTHEALIPDFYNLLKARTRSKP